MHPVFNDGAIEIMIQGNERARTYGTDRSLGPKIVLDGGGGADTLGRNVTERWAKVIVVAKITAD